MKEIQKRFGLSKTSVIVDLIIDKNGRIASDSIVSTNKPIANLNELKPYIKGIIDSMPDFIPATFRKHKVKSIKKIVFYFW